MVWLRMCGVSPTSRRALTARRFRFSSLSPLGSSRRWLAGLVLAFGLLGGTAATSSAALVLSVGIGNSQATALSNLAVVVLPAAEARLNNVLEFSGSKKGNRKWQNARF